MNSVYNTLKIAKELIYDKCNFDFTDYQLNTESLEYGACSFKLNGKSIQFRSAKITPTKTGQFVSIWKRNKNGITEPFDISDDINFIIIAAKKDDKWGQFIFPVSVLADKGIITKNGKEGKRGIRVYPPWDIASNKQAEKTQQWQIKYFVEIGNNNLKNLDLVRELLSKKISNTLI